MANFRVAQKKSLLKYQTESPNSQNVLSPFFFFFFFFSFYTEQCTSPLLYSLTLHIFNVKDM